MPGFAGVSDTGSISSLVKLLDHEDWYETDLVETNNAGLGLVHHGEKDPGGHTVWSGRRGAGVLYGAISNRQHLGLNVNEIFEAIIDRPRAFLPKLDGPFVVACYDARDGSLLAATDKLGTRDCYYAPTANGIAYGSELDIVLAQRDGVQLNEQAATDLLRFGHILGEKTLAKGVSALPPASLLQYSNYDFSVQRYWEPEFGQASADEYVKQTENAYRRTIADIGATMEGEVGLYLSGGIDSRLLAATLRDEYGPFRTLTYDGNPTDGSNPRIACQVADQLEIENQVIARTPGEFGSLVQKGVNITDGMISWEYFTNPNFVLNELHDEVDLILEGAPQGELFGEQIWRSDFQLGSVTEVLLRRMGDLSEDTVSSLLNTSTDPADSLREEVAKVGRENFKDLLIEVWLRNFCSNSHFRSSKLERSQVGTRIPFASGDLLNVVAQMPHQAYRQDTVPFSRKIPRSMSPLKRELIIHRDDELKDIPYERSRLPPAWPLWFHDATYLAKEVWRELALGRPTPVADWSREHEPMTQAINNWLDRASERPLFDEETIRHVRRAHFQADANHIRVIARLTTLEIWIERYLDKGVEPRLESMTSM